MQQKKRIPSNAIERNGEIITLTESEMGQIYTFFEEKEDARICVNEKIISYIDHFRSPYTLDRNDISDDDLKNGLSEKDVAIFHILLNFTEEDMNTLVNNFEDETDFNVLGMARWENLIDRYVEDIFEQRYADQDIEMS